MPESGLAWCIVRCFCLKATIVGRFGDGEQNGDRAESPRAVDDQRLAEFASGVLTFVPHCYTEYFDRCLIPTVNWL
ncbi:MAG: hypothetical protein DWQ45_12740 [Planctomycetota bacterium]|nr:MAG: hypothetical protein DWQ45_12740 [Planctomycetota bacterium]